MRRRVVLEAEDADRSQITVVDWRAADGTLRAAEVTRRDVDGSERIEVRVYRPDDAERIRPVVDEMARQWEGWPATAVRQIGAALWVAKLKDAMVCGLAADCHLEVREAQDERADAGRSGRTAKVIATRARA